MRKLEINLLPKKARGARIREALLARMQIGKDLQELTHPTNGRESRSVALKRITDALSHRDPAVNLEAARVLYYLKYAETVPALGGLITRKRRVSSKQARLTLEAARKQALVSLVMTAVVHGISEGVIGPLSAALHSRNPKLWKHAAKAIAMSSHPAAKKILENAAESHKFKKGREMARRALTEVLPLCRKGWLREMNEDELDNLLEDNLGEDYWNWFKD